MLNADLFIPRPTLTAPSQLAKALEALRRDGASKADVWRTLTERFTVDLDAVATLMPASDPEPIWLQSRD